MATQRKRRRGTTTEHSTFTGALGEVTLDTDRDGLVVHDGLLAGGFPIPNAREVQSGKFTAKDAGGTADAITLTLDEVPAAYAKYQAFRFAASANNTGPVTINVNSLGVKNVKKLDSDQAKVALAADDIVSGRIYTIVYDGTEFVISGAGLGSAAGSGLVVLEVLSATSVATAEFTAFDNATYDAYIIDLIARPASNGQSLNIRLSNDGGSTYHSGLSDYAWAVAGTNVAGVGTNSTDPDDSEIQTNQASGTAADDALQLRVVITRPGTAHARVIFYGFGHAGGDAPSCFFGGGTVNETDVDAIQFLFSSGNIEVLEGVMYGVPNSA